MMKMRAALLLASATIGCASTPAVSTPGAAVTGIAVDTTKIDAVLRGLRPRIEIAGQPMRWTVEERMAAHNVPGVSIAVIENGQVAWTRAIGVRQVGGSDAATPATLFQAGSISKPLAATALLRLVEQNQLDLDGDVNRWLRSWKVPESPFTATEKVTPRRLLTHSAGVSVRGFRGYAAGEAVPTLVQVLNGQPPANSPPIVVDTMPGAHFSYSGGGFTVLQQLLQDVTGESFEALMRRLVFLPVGMDRSTYAQPLPASLAADAARGHDPAGNTVAGGWHVMPEQAAAGLWTTAGELARWAIALSDAYMGRSSALMSQAKARQMLSSQQSGIGLGLPVGGSGPTLNFTHSGANVGFRAFVLMFPETGAGIAVLANNGSGGGPLADELIRAVAAEYGWPLHAPTLVTPVALDAASLAGLSGGYTLQIGPGRPVEVRVEEGRLVMHGPVDMVQPLIAQSATSFVNPENGWQFEFVRDASGRATALRVFPGSGEAVEGVRRP